MDNRMVNVRNIYVFSRAIKLLILILTFSGLEQCWFRWSHDTNGQTLVDILKCRMCTN